LPPPRINRRNLPTLLVQRDDLAIEDHVALDQFLPHPTAELLKAPEHVPPLRAEVAREALRYSTPRKPSYLGSKSHSGLSNGTG